MRQNRSNKIYPAGEAIIIIAYRKADFFKGFAYIIRQGSDPDLVNGGTELPRRPHAVLGLPLHDEAGKRVHDVPVRIHTESGDEVIFSFNIMGGEPYPLRPFARARFNAVERGYDLVAQEFVVFGNHKSLFSAAYR